VGSARNQGMRRGEALGLRWGDVDLDGERLTINRTLGKVGGKFVTGTPKSGKARTIDLDALTVEVLRAHKARQAAERLRLGEKWADQDLVSAHDGNKLGPDRKAGGFLNPEHVWRLFKTQVVAYNRGASAELALPEITIHELRHSWATMAMEQGISPKVVQERLGHATVAITLALYSHVPPTMQREAARLLASEMLTTAQ
jgi:integrase